MRPVVALMIAAGFAITGCASIDYQPFDGRVSQFEGTGGTKLVVNGIEFWADGAPPRRFTLLGVVDSEIGSGVGDESLIRSAVADEVRRRGGDAAVQIDNNSSFAGIVHVTPGFYMTTGVRRMRFAAIKYAQ